MKSRKEERLSFRITFELSERINNQIENNPEIRDRSDLGQKAVEYYLNFLEKKSHENQNEIQKIKNAVLRLAQELRISDSDEFIDIV